MARLTAEAYARKESPKKIYDALYNTENKQLKREVSALCNYVPYRLIAYLWQDQLKGKTDKEKNQIIEKLSRNREANVYSIFTINEDPKRIEVFSDWADYIVKNRKLLMEWIDQKIAAFVWKG